MNGWKDGWKDRPVVIHPCVPQDIGMLGLLLKKGGGQRRGKLVIQESHMVSGTRRPAWSDQLKKWGC